MGVIKGKEKVLIDKVARWYRGQGYKAETEYWCRAGRIDILTYAHVIEVILVLTRKKLFESIGQVLIYKQDMNNMLQAIVVGQRSNERVTKIVETATELGVTVQFWEDMVLLN